MVDQPGQHPRRPALLVDALGLQQLLEQANLVVGVEDREVALQPDQLGVPSQDLHADGVEGAEPGHALDRLADHGADALLHLASGLVGEGHRENLGRPRPAGREDVRNSRGQNPRFAGSGPRQHQHRAVQGLDRLALLGIEVVEIRRGSGASRHCSRGDAAGGGRRRVDGLEIGCVLRDQPRAEPVYENHG